MLKDQEQIDQINEQLAALERQEAQLRASKRAEDRFRAARVCDAMRELKLKRKYYEQSLQRHQTGTAPNEPPASSKNENSGEADCAAAHCTQAEGCDQPRMTGDEIKEAREAAGLSRRDLAVSLGVTYSAVYAWETGTAAPGDAVQQRLREVLRESPPLRKRRRKRA